VSRISKKLVSTSVWSIWAGVTVIFILDQLSKSLITHFIQAGQSVPVIKGVFDITFVMNTGAAFGMFKSQPYFFVAVAFLAVFFINFILIIKPDYLNTAEKTSLCFILAGTLGNLTDRLRLGAVIDFLDFKVWPVFNIADCFISVGAVVLGLSLLGIFKRRKT
jgi:signal peptidase II